MGVLIWWTVFGVFAPAATLVSFADLPRLVREAAPEVQVAKLEAEAAEARRGAFGRSFLPAVELEASQENFRKGTRDALTQPAFRAEASINLYRGGEDAAKNRVLDLKAQRARLSERASTGEVLTLARRLYLGILAQQERVEAFEEGLNQNKRNLAEANRRISAGIATVTDRLEFEMEAEADAQDIAEAKVLLNAKRRELADLLGLPKDFRLEAIGDHEHDWEKTQPLLEGQSIEARMAVLETESLIESRDLFRTELKPRVDLYAGVAQRNERDEPGEALAERGESYMGVRLRWDLEPWWSLRSEGRALSQEIEAKRTRARVEAQRVTREDETRLERLRALHQLIHGAEANVGRAETYLRATLKEYARGVKNSPDVLEATEKQKHSRLRKIAIVEEFNGLLGEHRALVETRGM